MVVCAGMVASGVVLPGAGLNGVHTFGWGLSRPVAMAADSAHLWIAEGSSVVELNANTGTFVAMLRGPSYQFADLHAIADDGADVRVAGNSAVTEINAATGGLVRVISGAAYQFAPSAIVSDGLEVWVENPSSFEAGTLTELNAQTGSLIRVVPGAENSFDGPNTLSLVNGHLWIADGLHSISELNAATGAVIRIITASRYQFDVPESIASDGRHVWVVNYGLQAPGSVTELDAINGSLIRVLPATAYSLYSPTVVTDGSDVVRVMTWTVRIRLPWMAITFGLGTAGATPSRR